MALSADLISQFVKITNDKPKEKKETTVYGTTVEHNGSMYVKMDGSEILTPVTTTTDMKAGERVTVMIKNHSATVTGNISSPAARTDDLKAAGNKITEFEIAIGYKVTTDDLSAMNAYISSLKTKLASIENADIVKAEVETLEAKLASLETITANDLTAITADIESIKAKFGDFKDISTEDLEALNADIGNLQAYVGDFTYISTDVLEAMKAAIKQLDTDKLSAEQANIKYANIEFTNIGKAAMEYFYAQSGLIDNVTINDGTITGVLVGVTIKGDTIETNTLVADKLVMLGEDGLYYKLNTDGMTIGAEQTEYNSLNGQVIMAKTITAEKVSVSDLVAFDATIGGFNITDDAIFSEVKDSEGNVTRGIYFDTDGQVNIGDASNFIKYVKDDAGNYHLMISADTIMYDINGTQRSIADLGLIGEYVHIRTYEGKPCIELGETDSDFKLLITNTEIMFMEGSDVPAYISNQSLHIKKAVIEDEMRQGNFVWKVRSNGNMGLMWVGGDV